MAEASRSGTTSSFLVEQAAHQNANGVLCLRRGDCGRAFHLFVSALTTLSKARQNLLAAAVPPPSLSSEAPAFQETRREAPLQCSSSVYPPPSSETSSTPEAIKNCRAIAIPYLEDTGFYVYNHALVFSRNPHIGDTNCAFRESFLGGSGGRSPVDVAAIYRLQQRQAVLSSQIDTIIFCEAVARFNLGLTYHQRGKHFGEDQTLLGALEHYAQSLVTLQSIDSKSARESKDVRVLRLAVTNNRIHILNEMARYPAAQALVNDFLLQSVQTLSDTSEADASSDSQGSSPVAELALRFLTRSDIDNFLLNALVIRRYNTAPCA